MAKGRKKKQRRPQVPALSREDKALYIGLMVLSPLVGWGLMTLWIRAVNGLAAEPGVVAVSSIQEGGVLLFGYLFVHVGIFYQLKLDKIHLFGRRDITYGPPKWKAAYPVFRKHPKVERTPKERRKLLRNWILYFAVWAVILAVLAMTFYPRELWMADGGVEVYDAFNHLTQVYEPENVEQVCFASVESYHGRHSRRAELQIRLQMEDGTEFLFTQQDLNRSQMDRTEELRSMIRLKEYLGHSRVSFRIDETYDLEALIADLDFTAEEAGLLYQLFAE